MLVKSYNFPFKLIIFSSLRRLLGLTHEDAKQLFLAAGDVIKLETLPGRTLAQVELSDVRFPFKQLIA